VQYSNGVGELVVRHGNRIERRGRVVVVLLLVDGIVPERRAGIEAEPSCGKIQLRIKIEAVGDEARVEAPVAIIGVPASDEIRVLTFEPHGGAVFDRIVPAQLGIAIAIELHRRNLGREAKLKRETRGGGERDTSLPRRTKGCRSRHQWRTRDAWLVSRREA